MSVKKSLWISLAVMALSLVFLGCPTEASSSSTEERAPYEQTALWEAVIDAQNNLSATPVSDLVSLDPTATPDDIVKDTEYVTADQAAAFKKAIGEAQSVAYGLRPSIRAIEPTEAEKPALAALAAAQARFDAYKETNPPATGVEVDTAKKINDNSTDPLVITGNVVLDDAVDLEDKYVTIAPGAKLTTSSLAANTFDISDAGTLVIKNGGTFEIVSTTERAGSTTYFVGTIIVEAGGTFINRAEEDYWLADATNNTGFYIIKAGGVLISGGRVLVGPTEGANRGQIFQLKSGTITVGAPATTGKPLTYALAGDVDLEIPTGDANLAGSLEISELVVDGALNVADKVDLYGVDDADLLTGEDGAKIILAGTGSSITILDTTGWDAIDGTSGKEVSDALDDIATLVDKTLPWVFGGGAVGTSGPYKPYHIKDRDGFRLTGPVVLQYDDNAGLWE
jgi:hypothetical protein